MKKISLFVLGLVLVGGSFSYYSSAEDVQITVNDKEHVMYRNGSDLEDKYMVYSEGEVFKNTDDIFYFKFNSSDVQNELKEGNSYNVKVVGWRIPFLSMHRNIISIK